MWCRWWKSGNGGVGMCSGEAILFCKVGFLADHGSGAFQREHFLDAVGVCFSAPCQHIPDSQADKIHAS